MNAQAEPSPEVDNPFPGPRPYRGEDRARFHGRDVVARELCDTIAGQRCVVLHGPSGAGKSSVMQAAVLPGLAESYDFRHVVVDGWPAGETPVAWLTYAIASQLKLAAPEEALGVHESVEWAISRAFRRSDRPLLIYLDQLEQLLLPGRAPAKVDVLLDWLDRFAGQPLRGMHLVLAMREDYLGRFRDRARGRHRLLEHGFRLGPMTVGEIVGAVCLAALAGRPRQSWSPASMRTLMLQVRTPGQSASDDAEIQAAFAQIVCRALFDERAERLLLDEPALAEDVEAEPILQRYFESTLAGLGALRAAAEELMEDHLVAADGSRMLLTEEAARASGLLVGPDLVTVLTRLEQAAILRAEQHRGSRYFEIGHDWLARRLFERKQERAAGARELARQRELEEQRLATEEKLRQAQRETRRARAVVAIVSLLALAALLLGVFAWTQRRVAIEEKNNAVAATERARRERDAADAAREEAQQARTEAEDALASEKNALALAERAASDALAQKKIAEAQRRSAEASERAAKQAAKQARDALAGLRAANREVDLQRAQAEEEARRARDANRLAVALKVMADDPTTALALLREVEDPERTRGWTPATVEALQRPASRAVLREHQGYVVAVDFSPDGRVVATASHDGTARLIRVDGTQPSRVLEGHTDRVVDVAFSPGGDLAATASVDGTARLWRLDGTSVALRGHTGPLERLAFSPDGKRLATASRDRTVMIWETGEPRNPLRLAGHRGAVRSIAFRPDGEALVSSSDDGTARVWRLAGDGPEPPIVLAGHEGTVHGAAFSPDGEQVVTAGDDRTARLWRVGRVLPGSTITGGEVLAGHTDVVYSADFSPLGDKIVTASRDRTARVWTLGGRGKATATALRGHTDKVYVARFDPTGTRIATVSRDGTARLWAADRTSEVRELRGHTRPVVDVRFSPDGEQVVTVAEDGTARVWDADGARRERVLRGHPGAVRLAAFLGKGPDVVTVSEHTIGVWSSDGHTINPFEHERGRLIIGISSDGTRAYTALADGTATLWKIGPAPPLTLLGGVEAGHRGLPGFVSFSPDRRRVVTSSTNTAWIVGLEDDTRIALRGHEGMICHAEFDASGTRVVTGSEDRTARVWRADGSGTPVILRGHEGSVHYVAFSPDGARVVTASWDGSARIWSADGVGDPLILRGSGKPLRSAEFSHDGLRVVAASDDHTARIWSADGRGDTVALHGHEGAVLHATFSPDDRLVVTGSVDRTARVWSADFAAPALLRSRIAETTTVCLAPQQRTNLLAEEAALADARYRDCEAAAGRGASRDLVTDRRTDEERTSE